MQKHTLSRAWSYLSRYGIKATANEISYRLSRTVGFDTHPAAIHVEVSNCCNLHCEYCVLDQGAEGDKTMSEQTFEALLPSLARARRIDLSGLAEPLMNKRFPSMLKRVRAIAPNAHITVCTNATLMTEEIAEHFVEQGLDELVFSLDGVDPALVDEVRRGGSLEGVIHNIAMLRDVKARRGASRPVVSATVVLRPDNAPQLPDIVRLAAELGAVGVNVNGLEPYTPTTAVQTLWNAPVKRDVASALSAAEVEAKASGLELRLPAFSPQIPKCPQVFRPIVLADGTVVPCSVLAYHRDALFRVRPDLSIEERRGVVDRLTFGNAKVSGLESIWKGAGYRAFRKAVDRGNFPDVCSACLLKHDIICPTPPLSAAESLATSRRGED